ncbi:MAG: hypothetical protein LBN02_01960 [Oscillospiraceae bacterium]|nr:hypothetical protein [Oscillospiraceae bacterium]
MTHTDALLAWFTENEQTCAARAETLREDSREDDATLERVRGNVYRMFGAMFQVAARVSEGEPASAKQLFADRAEPLAAKWEQSHRKAELNNDVETATVERVKLDVIAEIRARVDALGRADA